MKYKKYPSYPKIYKPATHTHNYLMIVGTRYSISKKAAVTVWKCVMCSARTERKI